MFKNEDQEAESIDAQKAVLDEALDKFVERNRVHQDLWAEDGVAGSVQSAYSKIMRVRSMAERATTPEQMAQLRDDAIDGVNYLVFAIRNLEEAAALDGEGEK